MIAATGAWTRARTRDLVEVGALPLRAASGALRHPRDRAVREATVLQVWFTGVEAVPVTLAMAVLLGALATGQVLALVSAVGIEGTLGTGIRLVLVRELAPLVTAILVLARSGSAVAVDLGGLVLRGEIDQREDTLRTVVLPRLLGIPVAAACLEVLFVCGSLVGGWAMAAVVAQTAPSVVVQLAADALAPADVLLGVAKAASFGLVIATIACQQGLAVGADPLNLARVTRRAVLYGFVAVIVLDGVFALLLYGVLA